METKKFATNQERVDCVLKASAARNAKIAAQLATQPKKTAKTTAKKQKKALSKAALQRLELERQEAAKSKVEKLAESIKRRSTVSGKHDSVVTQVDTVKKRNAPVKKAKLNPIKKVKQQAPMPRGDEYAIQEARNAERSKQFQRLFKQAETIRNRLDKIGNREATKLHEGLRDCYGIYEFVENHNDPDIFYNTIKAYYQATLIKIQSNTPDEGLLARFIFPMRKDEDNKRYNKRISEYGTVIRYARETGVAKKDFIKWYTGTTQTRILEKARKSATSDNKDKLARAKIALLRYFDIREEKPLGHFDYPEFLAAKQVHLPDDLIFVICRGVRKFNRDVHFDPENPAATRVPMAEISALHFIPPNVDLINDIITRVARELVPNIDDIEKQIEDKTEEVWAHDMTGLLMERELGAAYKSADRWADRMQAAMAEDQVAFEAKRRKIQKLRNKARK